MKKNGEIELTMSKVNAILTSGNYHNQRLCVEMAEKIKVHAEGRMPTKLILERRPNESEAIKEYRSKIYEPITKKTVSKVFSSLEKIRRSQDWNIKYDTTAVPKVIADSETMERYCEYNYPHFTSLTNWAFSLLLRNYLIDANGIIAIIPMEVPESSAEYVRPVAEFFGSDQVVDYVEGEYVVLKSKDTTTYTTHNGTRANTNGSIYYIITKNEVLKYEQINTKELSASTVYRHNIGSLPAFKAGGIFFARKNNDTIYESRIAGIIPDMDEAVRVYSDLQAEILQHIHSEKYVYANSDCPVCNGTGREWLIDEAGNEIQRVCKHCNGRGSVTNVSPYGEYVIQASKIGESSVPTPPIGYVQKSTDIAKFSDENVRQHIYDALSAINMEFLAETPLAQSGVAKAYDKEELNNFVNAIAEDIVRILDLVYYYIGEYRYKIIVPNDEQRRAMLPKINVPTKFDIIAISTIVQDIKIGREAKLNPAILRELEIDYAKRQFNTDPTIADMVTLIYDLDPLYGIEEDTKMTMKANGGITNEDYIISCNITQFVRRAVRENKDFIKLPYDNQMKTLCKYAAEVTKKNEVQIQMPNVEE
ncbi:MAG: hypothetical protein IKC81_05680 [Paludibacteraceae bacterium]|nr:hypothetical protein [Paludibacteraceae bacterium]